MFSVFSKRKMTKKGCEILIIGGGITGLTIARELIKRNIYPIYIIEKESDLARHASGRNSGVLHSGIYYTPDSLKARFCVEGNKLMKQYCKQNNLPLLECGKVIVAKDEKEHKGLYELKKRADDAGAFAEIIDEKSLSKIEPYAKTCSIALYVPNTAVIEPISIMKSLSNELINSYKCYIAFDTKFIKLKSPNVAVTNKGLIYFNKCINAAGAYADKIAHTFDIAKEYKILPFKGTYKKLKKEKNHMVRSNIYPVPDLRNPFLGVHFTRTTNDVVYVGPTAIPSFGRENYHIIDGIGAESISILYRDATLLLCNDLFRYSALNEIQKYRFYYFYKAAQSLIPMLDYKDLLNSTKIGIRPQLINWTKKELVNDFIVIRADNSIHILNAISPAFTTSMSFATYIVNETTGL